MKAIALSTILLLALPAGCASDDDGGVTADEATVFAVSTDYVSTGVASTVALPSLEVTQNAVDGVASTDPVVRYIDGRIYIVNRFGADNITILEPDLTLAAQISTGAGSNPQDVAVVGDKLYVAALATAGVLVLDVTRPDDGVIDTIDLSSFDTEDGIPNCNAAVAVDGRVFVACSVLDDDDGMFTPRGPGQIAVIDAETDTVETTFAMIGTNPQGDFFVTPGGGPLDGDLLIDATPDYGDLTAGCLERIAIDPPASSGCLIQHADLGGVASGMTWADGQLWLAVTEGWDDEDYQPLGKIHAYDAGELSLADSPMTPDSQRAFDVVYCPTGHLVVADAAGGLRVYDRSGTELTTELLDIGLPPIGSGMVCF